MSHLDESSLPEYQEPAAQNWQNVSRSEQKVSLVTGAALVLVGLLNRGVTRFAGLLAGGAMIHRATTGHCYLYQALGINSADQMDRPGVRDQKGQKIVRSIIINRPRAELFAFWRKLENLPSVMSHVKSVEVLDSRRSRWTVKAPAGMSVQWDAEIINERDEELIAWQSLPGAQIPNAGSVRFEDSPGGGTELKVALEYEPPVGEIGDQLAAVFHEAPEQQLEDDLQRFKEQMESSASSPS